jgi:hypothetical protein
MKPGDLVSIGTRSKYAAVNRVNNRHVNVTPDQIGLLLHIGSRDQALDYVKWWDSAMFDGVVLSFEPTVLSVIE